MVEKSSPCNGPGMDTRYPDVEGMSIDEMRRELNITSTVDTDALLADPRMMEQYALTSAEGVLRQDALLDCSRIVGQNLESKFGLQNTANIATCIMVDSNLQLNYRGNIHQTISDMKDDVEETVEYYLEQTALDRDRYIKKVTDKRKRCSECEGDCEFCRYARYNVINRGE